ncbi:MAG TPA: restriction endonuclease subunit S, partial [Bacteroidia bacterium]|nr:restriction endonuclease subunit S [Bacteroidia bacterium]
KIAKILSTWDELIEKQTKLIAAKEKRKNALMQKLLTGKVRFPGSKGKWRTVKVEDIAANHKGAIKIGPFGSQLKKQDFTNAGYKIYDQETTFSDNFFGGNNFIGEEKFQSLKSCEVFPGDVLVSMMGSIGSVVIVPPNAPRGILNSHLLRIKPNTQLISSAFLKLSLGDSPVTQAQIKSKSHGGIMSGLSASIIRSITFQLPPDQEQDKISELFSNLDSEIKLLNIGLDKMQAQKRGLMQQLLTGKIRVKI